jgi:hypothetical protein
MLSNLRAPAFAFLLVVGSVAFSQANVITVTSGQAGGGLVIVPSEIVAAVDVFPQQSSPNVVQGVTFTSSNPHVSISQAYGSQVNGGPGANGSFDGSSNPDDIALTNVDRSIAYGQQTIILSGLIPNANYNLQILTTDGGYNERNEDFAINGVHTDTVDVLMGQTYNVTNNVHADSTGTITVLMSPNFTNASLQDPNPTLAGLVLTAPEPASIVLWTLGGTAFILATRLRRKV